MANFKRKSARKRERIDSEGYDGRYGRTTNSRWTWIPRIKRMMINFIEQVRDHS